MRTLALLTQTETKRISWVLVQGTKNEPQLITANIERIKFPADIESGSGLSSLLKTIGLLIDTQKPEQITILQAGNSQFRGASPIRVKAEAVLQIAAAQKGIATHLVPSQTLTTFKKKIEQGGNTPHSLVGREEPLLPQDMNDAVCLGLLKLPNE